MAAAILADGRSKEIAADWLRLDKGRGGRRARDAAVTKPAARASVACLQVR